MKRVQFSLTAILAFTVILSVLILFVAQWTRLGEQTALERLLCIFWWTALVLSFWKSTKNGWRRIVQVAVITGAIWTGYIFATHLMFLRSMVDYGGDATDIYGRAVLVAVIGFVAAFLAACSIQFVLAARSFWRMATTRMRFSSASVLAMVVLVGMLLYFRARARDWEPVVLPASEAPNWEPGVIPKWSGGIFLGDFQFSPDGRFMSAAERGKRILLVFDAQTLTQVAQLRSDSNGYFLSITFLPDSSGLVAVHRDTQNNTSIMRWKTSDWRTQQRVPLDQFQNSEPVEPIPILFDHILLLLYVYKDNDQAEMTQARIATIDLLKEVWTPTLFVSMSTQIQLPLDLKLLTTHLQPWHKSPSGECIVSQPDLFEHGTRWLFRRGSPEPIRLPGHRRGVLGFFAESEYVVVSERSRGLVWRRFVELRQGTDRPPFWDHSRIEEHHRVIALECMNGNKVAQSRWWPCFAPYLDLSRSRVAAGYWNSALIWEIPKFDALSVAHSH